MPKSRSMGIRPREGIIFEGIERKMVGEEGAEEEGEMEEWVEEERYEEEEGKEKKFRQATKIRKEHENTRIRRKRR